MMFVDRVLTKICSAFQSIPISLWWAVVTLATVGYGDMVPQTPLGKFAAGLVILVGVLVRTFHFQNKIDKKNEISLQYAINAYTLVNDF